jgi:uncharacterized protein with PQ loop repeat
VGNLTFIATTVPVVMLLLSRQRDWALLPAVAVPLTAAAVVILVLLQLPSAVSGGLGVLCGLLTTLPQLLESRQRRRAGEVSEVSMATLVLLLGGQSLWLSYGLARPDVPMIITNVVAVTVTVSLIVVEASRRRVRL